MDKNKKVTKPKVTKPKVTKPTYGHDAHYDDGCGHGEDH